VDRNKWKSMQNFMNDTVRFVEMIHRCSGCQSIHNCGRKLRYIHVYAEHLCFLFVVKKLTDTCCFAL